MLYILEIKNKGKALDILSALKITCYTPAEGNDLSFKTREEFLKAYKALKKRLKIKRIYTTITIPKNKKKTLLEINPLTGKIRNWKSVAKQIEKAST